MDINNCYEATMEMEQLSSRLIIFLEENQEANGVLSGSIDNIERKFLTIKHSLDLITLPQYNKSAYNLGLEMVQYKNELNELFEKKQYEMKQDTRRYLGHKIDQIEAKYLEIKKDLLATTYAKNLKFI